METERDNTTLFLFDVDRTLTNPRSPIEDDMLETLKTLSKKCHIGFVGGADLVKIKMQNLGEHVKIFDYQFGENGAVAYKNNEVLEIQDLSKIVGEKKLQKWIKFALSYIVQLDLPVMRGYYLDYRNGMINISPAGSTLSKQQRNDFEQLDKKLKIREKMIAVMKVQFPDIGLEYAIGGQASFDVFPIGWNKTFCLRYLKEYKTIHFFGDKTQPGGNDYELYASDRTIGHAVTGPADTIKLIKELTTN